MSAVGGSRTNYSCVHRIKPHEQGVDPKAACMSQATGCLFLGEKNHAGILLKPLVSGSEGNGALKKHEKNIIRFVAIEGLTTLLRSITLWLFNIAMDNGPFIDSFPIEPSI